MTASDDRRHPISEVSQLLDVPMHQLRQWEARIPQLKPKRDRVNRRYYTAADIEIVRRIKELVHGEGLTLQGARKRLDELRDANRPKTNADMIEILDGMESELRAMLDILDANEKR